MENDEIIYFELNNWMSGKDFPNDDGIFEKWCGDDSKLYFNSDRWCKENNLVVTLTRIDQSYNWCIGATKKWVEENCPELLTKYTNFLRPTKESRFDQPFKEYSEENIGLHLCVLPFNSTKWKWISEEDSKEFKEGCNEDIYGEE